MHPDFAGGLEVGTQGSWRGSNRRANSVGEHISNAVVVIAAIDGWL
jgi:hypothetical protein